MYDRSKVMKWAWEIRRKNPELDFGECQRRANIKWQRVQNLMPKSKPDFTPLELRYTRWILERREARNQQAKEAVHA